MALTDNEIREEWSKKESTVKDYLKDNELELRKKASREYRDKVEAEREAYEKREAAKNYGGRLVKDPNDKNVKTYWQEVAEDAERLQNENYAGYNDWTMTQIGLINSAAKLGKAMWNDPIEITNLIPYSDEIGGLWKQGKDTFYDELLWDKIKTVKRLTMKDSELAPVEFKASIDENGYLKVEATADGEPDPQLARHLAVGIGAWATTQGYEIDQSNPNAMKFKDNANQFMTQQKFKELNEDPEQSVNKFVTGRFEIPVVSNLLPGAA